jgi:predicted deacetylase
MSPTEPARLACIELHDVAPATWPECAAILRMLDDAGATRLTLLVVPHFHRGARVGDDAAFLRALDGRSRAATSSSCTATITSTRSRRRARCADS